MTKPTKMAVHPAKTQISLGIRLVWSESSLCAQWVAKDPRFLFEFFYLFPYLNPLHWDLCRDMTKPTKMAVHPAKTQISLGIRLVWSESSLCAQWVAKDPRFLHADSEDSDQTGRIQSPRYITWHHTRSKVMKVFSIKLILYCTGVTICSTKRLTKLLTLDKHK